MLGKKFAQNLPSKVFLLTGELGGGKTQFVKGLAEGLGITEPVSSPTFTYEKIYENSKGPDLYHFDLYRSDVVDPDIALLIKEAIESGAIVAIEWAERAREFWPKGATLLEFSWEDENDRLITESRI